MDRKRKKIVLYYERKAETERYDMGLQIEIKKGIPYPLGATMIDGRINFAAVMYTRNECGVILYDSKNDSKCRIPFRREHRIGNICCMSVVCSGGDAYEYNFYDGDQVITDPYARRIIGRERWGCAKEQTQQLRAGISSSEFDWQEDAPLRIPYEDSVFYCMHVRGFTKSRLSGVRKKGTFAGIIEKIPYLKELGIKNIELMPIYEFSEFPVPQEENSMQYAAAHYMDKPGEKAAKSRLNYWGYCDAFYFAPKASYAASDDPVLELKQMIRALHQNGIEVICQFYFPDSCKQGYILEVIRYWVLEYHIDGIHLMGNGIPVTLIATEPLFSNTKLIYQGFPCDQIYPGGEVPEYRNLAAATDAFMADARRYLKSDEGMLRAMMYHLIDNPAQCGVLHFITNYYGFTLYDLVSYNRKHNEENGEDNRDGNDYNFSWNCGAEGPARKAAVVRLRMRQLRNAMTLVVLSQGTPFLTAGDEDCNTQRGNNNPYCQDNEIGWKDWSKSAAAAKQFAFVRELLAFRAGHPVFRKKGECRFTDQISCGFPELSFHSDEAYRVKAGNGNRHMGMLYAGEYGDQKGCRDENIYLAYNMHWTEHRFALPKLPRGYGWRLVMDTDREDSFAVDEWRDDGYTITAGRSIQVLVGCRKKEKAGGGAADGQAGEKTEGK